ncbi:MAG: (2Fe-2S)-binding protein [Burkholderiales bacterium]|nr:(2Fe-2S)-binding protein [Burkholderiales bacterium]
MSGFRLPAGGRIDRARVLPFDFDGRRYQGFAGDTLASALLANGVRLVGRSFKYHRPRGVLSLANHDVNAMVTDGISPNLRADGLPLCAGMRLLAVNTFGSLHSDRARVIDKLARFLPVGFYYKTFFRPKWTFPHWERLIRRISGLGQLNFQAARPVSAKRYDFADVLVIGAGPAGLAAAVCAGRAGARVILVDENAQAGGSLTYARPAGEAAATAAELLAALAAQANVEVRTATFAAGYYADHWVPLVDAGNITKVRAKAVVVATGVFEQPAVFRNNDLPGVMLASAAQRLIHRYAVQPMREAVVLTANEEGYAAALDLLDAGVRIQAVIDLTRTGEKCPAALEVAQRGVRILLEHCIVEAHAAGDGSGVKAVSVAPWNGSGMAAGARETIACDGVAMSVGFAPATALLHQAGAHMRYEELPGQFVPVQLPEGVFAAGRVNGVYDLADRMRDGERAAWLALAHIGLGTHVPAEAARARRAVSHPFPFVEHARGKNFIDFDEDLQLADFYNAAQEGFDNIELLKRYTTVGMGPSQGKHSNMNAVRILAHILKQPIDSVGTTTARPFFHPVPLGHLAGRGFHPVRRTALHARHQQLDAVFMEAGMWLRPEYYARSGKSKAELVREEAKAVRTGAGLIDVGTLGKIELSGADAGELLERVYTGRFRNMKPGTTRYGIMLDEAGVVIDDGVIGRLAEHKFYFTTTTTGSATVYRELQRLITMWGLRAGIVNLTGACAAINLAGPSARTILAQLADFDVGENAFPYLALREGTIAGMPARLMRVGFVGELGFEIHMPSEHAPALWDLLMRAGASHGIRPFGVEAQRLLRLEKGHIIIGQDTDGLTTPFEAALEWAVKMDKPFFVGQRSLQVLHKQPLRQKLAGFMLERDFNATPPKECHLVIRDGQIAGRVTSIGWSEALGRHFGLVFLAPDLAKEGMRFLIRVDGGAMVEAQVVSTPFYDPQGLRQKALDPAPAAMQAVSA